MPHPNSRPHPFPLPDGLNRKHQALHLLRAALALLMLLWPASFAQATEYGYYDLRRVLTVTTTAAGKKIDVNLPFLDQVLSDLAHHAHNAPAHFDTPQNRQFAVQDVKALSEIMEILTNEPNPSPEILRRAGFLHSMAHNLDIAGSAPKASTCFKKLLLLIPADPEGNYLYGVFLAGTGKPEAAIPYLETAWSKDITNAAHSLGLAYLSLGDTGKALEKLEAYRQRRPNDSEISHLIENIHKSRVDIKNSQQKPPLLTPEAVKLKV